MSNAATATIARAGPGEVPTLSGALARAFEEDPVFEWLVPDAPDRRARLPSVFAAFADLYLTQDETYLAGDGVGAALWSPAGGEPFSEKQLAAFGEGLGTALGDTPHGRGRSTPPSTPTTRPSPATSSSSWVWFPSSRDGGSAADC
ncbi:hypothetical protein BH23ACT5_BH23ACT5_20530 [soil metagenome]